jgi:hypothetical protein
VQRECPQEREKLAYLAQERWLGLFGHNLESDFDLNPFSLLVKTKCFYYCEKGPKSVARRAVSTYETEQQSSRIDSARADEVIELRRCFAAVAHSRLWH